MKEGPMVSVENREMQLVDLSKLRQRLVLKRKYSLKAMDNLGRLTGWKVTRR